MTKLRRERQYDERMTKKRITVTVDEDLAQAGADAVANGQAESVSAWVNEALQAHSEHGRRVAAMHEAVAAYEAEFGEITEEEMAEQDRQDRAASAEVWGDADLSQGAA